MLIHLILEEDTAYIVMSTLEVQWLIAFIVWQPHCVRVHLRLWGGVAFKMLKVYQSWF